MEEKNPLILPWHPEFHQALAAIPPDFNQARHEYSGDIALVCPSGSDIMVPLGGKELEDYILGGEMEERQAQLEFMEQLEAASWINSGFLLEEDEEELLTEES